MKWSVFSKYRDEIYGLSILWIMIFHGIEIKKVGLDAPIKWLTPFFKHGNLGVEVFLFLSGICLYYSMKNDEDIAHFYKKRLKRIIFPFFVVAGSYWFFRNIIVQGNFLAFVKHLTLWSFWVNGNSAEWFIALILPLYVLYPFLYRYFIKNNRRSLLLILIVVVYGLLFFFKTYYPLHYLKIEVALTRIPVFLIGCYCGKLVYENTLIKQSWIYCWTALTVLLWGGYYFNVFTISKFYRIPYFFAGPLICLVFCIFLYFLDLRNMGDKARSFLIFIGAISLELYLTHLTLRRFFVASRYYGNFPPVNFHEYIILVLGGALILSVSIQKLFRKFIK